MPDNYSQWERHDNELERLREQLPVCADCGEPVQYGHYYRINDEVICPDCIESNYREEIEDFFE